MYVKRVQLVNYGPIDQLDIEFPFDGDAPKPVFLVGENGSGKSVLLSHIVNGLVLAKNKIYPYTPEVEQGTVYKIRSPSYIKLNKEFYYARVDFEKELFVEEIYLSRPKQENTPMPDGFFDEDARNAWGKIKDGEHDFFSSIKISGSGSDKKIEDVFSKNCILYCPPNRFEEPAWLNEENLKAKAKYMDMKHLHGHTERKVISYSPLQDNQNWLFDVIYDHVAFELKTDDIQVPVKDQVLSVKQFTGYSGQATNVYEIALQIVRRVIRRSESTRFGIGRRLNRVVSIVDGNDKLVPNIFQLSSGETALLNLFLSILRDFDLSGATFAKANEVRGIVIVDEIDLHLHAVHQYEILPVLMKMFPHIQFVVTTHSPLFVLGMKNTFGEDGFALYRLPQGYKISPEEFGEFETAYKTFSETKQFADDMREAIDNAQKPMLYVEGTTDIKYIKRAAELLNQETLLEKFELKDGGGNKNLDKVWQISKLPDSLPQKIVLLYDCDYSGGRKSNGTMFKLKTPMQSEHPIKKGIENLFPRATLGKAKKFKPAFINVKSKHTVVERGEKKTIPEEWTVDPDEKSNLCNWLCKNGTADDFQNFRTIFDLLEETITGTSSTTEGE